jgi:hypothetical protein
MSELVISIAVNVALGLLLLALLTWKRPDDGERLAGEHEALEIFRTRYPEAEGVVTVASDGRGALIVLHPGPAVGLIQRQGRRWNVCMLQSGQLTAVRSQDERVDLRLADFGWPRARIRIGDAVARAAWLARLTALARPNSGPSRTDLGHA